MPVAVAVLLVLTLCAMAALFLSERRRRLVHELAAYEALQQLEHEKATGELDRHGRREAVRQRVERKLHGAGRLTRGHRRALRGLYR